MNSAPRVQSDSPPVPSLAGVEVRLILDEVDVVLQPSLPQRELWHRAVLFPNILVSLRSTQTEPRLLRLSVRSEAPRWNPRWIRWTGIQQKRAADDTTPLFEDALSENETTLTLQLTAEPRAVSVEFAATLDEETFAGDYPFDIVVTDAAQGAETAVLGMLRLRHPLSALFEYLPQIYTAPQPDPRDRLLPYQERPFFERFLCGFEDALLPLQQLLAHRERWFQPDTTPADFLPWLARWVALTLDDNWSELKRRRLIGEAVELYRWRGTKRGLTRYLEIYAGVTPQIEDKPFEGMRLGSDLLLTPETRLGGLAPHCFSVTLSLPEPDSVSESVIRRIIEAEKPAHAAYELRILARSLTQDAVNEDETL